MAGAILTQATITTVDELQRYLRMARARAGHHAAEVSHVIATVIGAVLIRKDPGVPMACRQNMSTGEPTPQLVVQIGGRDFLFNYDHTVQKIKVQQNNALGPIVAYIDNTTPAERIDAIFSVL